MYIVERCSVIDVMKAGCIYFSLFLFKDEVTVTELLLVAKEVELPLTISKFGKSQYGRQLVSGEFARHVHQYIVREYQ